MTHQIIAGWEGRFFEDFAVGHLYRSRFGHTVTEADNALFTQLTHNTNPLHFDAEYARRTQWGQILVNSTFTLALIVGMSVPDISENAVANLGWEEVKLTHPVFIGNTLYCETEVLDNFILWIGGVRDLLIISRITIIPLCRGFCWSHRWPLNLAGLKLLTNCKSKFKLLLRDES